jgi:hypothetical protein
MRTFKSVKLTGRVKNEERKESNFITAESHHTTKINNKEEERNKGYTTQKTRTK